MDIIEEGMTRLFEKGPLKVPSHTVHSGQPHHAAISVTHHLPILTQSLTVSSACAAGLDAIGFAANLIRQGKAHVALCGGSDAPINPMTFACLAKTGLMSLRRCRGATALLEITGHASLIDPDWDTPASGLEMTMRQALANASMRPANVDYICAHGPGHPLMDRNETKMIKAVFGHHCDRIPVSSIKGVTGNPLAAGGAFQVIACAQAFREHTIPPTANLEKPDPECDLDDVPLVPRRADLKTILINSHGLGGGNSTLIVERVALT